MNWDDIVGQHKLKKLLQESIGNKRVGHAQLFVGESGYGTLPLAIAFAREVFLQENPSSAVKVDSLNHVDLHFSFPVFKEKKEGLSSIFAEEFREMIIENPYARDFIYDVIKQLIARKKEPDAKILMQLLKKECQGIEMTPEEITYLANKQWKTFSPEEVQKLYKEVEDRIVAGKFTLEDILAEIDDVLAK